MEQPLFGVPDKIRVMIMAGLKVAHAFCRRTDLDYYLPLMREFHRVANEIDQDLPQPCHVTDKNLRDGIIDKIGQVESLLGRFGRQ